MQIFQDIDDKSFSYNGRKYVKNFIVTKAGDTNIAVYNAYDTRMQLMVSTHYSEIQIDGEVPEDQAEAMAVLSPIIFSKILGSESIIIANQNNIARYLQRGFLAGTGNITPTEVANHVNITLNGFTVSETSTPVIFEFLRTDEGITSKYLFLFTGGKGIWGTLGSSATPVTSFLFKLISIQVQTPSDISDDPNSNIQNLGEIPDGDYISVANETEWDFTDTETSYYFSYTQDDVLYFVLFVGEAGVYGGGMDNDDFSESDFISTTNSDVTPVVIPSLQEVITVDGTYSGGNTLSVAVSDEDGSAELKINGAYTSITKDGNGLAIDENGVGFNSPVYGEDAEEDNQFVTLGQLTEASEPQDLQSVLNVGSTATILGGISMTSDDGGNASILTLGTDGAALAYDDIYFSIDTIVRTNTQVEGLDAEEDNQFVTRGQLVSFNSNFYSQSSANTTTVNTLAFVDELPSEQDAETTYFVNENTPVIYEGSISLSANGTTIIDIPHSLSGTPTYVNVQPKNSGATDISYVTVDTDNIYINYSIIPTGMLEYWLKYNE